MVVFLVGVGVGMVLAWNVVEQPVFVLNLYKQAVEKIQTLTKPKV